MTDDLINTIERPGEFDALVKLQPGEPYFVLIGRDRSAPGLVDGWADTNRRRAIADHDGGLIGEAKLHTELRQSTQAEMIGCAMRAFKTGHPADPVEVPSETKRSYSGHRLDATTEARDREVRVRARSASAINNAVAELVEVGKALAEFEHDGRLETAIIMLKEAADRVVPKRAIVQ